MSHFSQLLELNKLQAFLDSDPFDAAIARTDIITLSANNPPWQTSGISLQLGQEFSLFAQGQIIWRKKAPQLFGGPAFHLWARIHPHGKIFNITGETGTFIADTEGILQLGIYMGMWANDLGELCHTHHYARLSGELLVLAVAWQGNAAKAIASLKNPLPIPPLLTTERTRLERQYNPPLGWHYLTETGTAEIFHGSSDNLTHDEISLDAVNDQGIIRYPVELPLTEQLRLSWQWRLDDHPSLGPEDKSECHDYVSVAAEFDNGRDLSWIWSQHLPNDHHFHCPVRDWTERETHYVVRNRLDLQGEWVKESRYIRADVQTTQGEPPGKVVAIWLIAVSTFSHGRLRAKFRDIELTGSQRLKIL